MKLNRCAALAAGIAAMAATAYGASFEEVDANGDGAVTQEEFQAAFPDAGPEAWVATDTNGDGGVTADELQAAIEAGVLPEG